MVLAELVARELAQAELMEARLALSSEYPGRFTF